MRAYVSVVCVFGVVQMQNEDFRRLLSNPDYIRAMSNLSVGMQDLERLGVGPG